MVNLPTTHTKPLATTANSENKCKKIDNHSRQWRKRKQRINVINGAQKSAAML
jgi:hypothetical protein